MPSLHYVVVVVTFILLASEVLCEEAKFPGSSGTDKMCPYNKELSDVVRKNFTDTHNYRRSQLALGKVKKQNGLLSAAANLIKLEWDCFLERNATDYVRKCPSGESKENERPGSGELYHRVSVSEGDLKDAALLAVSSWWKVARQVTEDKCIGDNAKFSQKYANTSITTFTQMAWAETTKLGCAIGRCLNKEKKEDYVVICRYYPKGNLLDKQVYIPGPACTKCPRDYTCTTPSHCDQQNCQGLCI